MEKSEIRRELIKKRDEISDDIWNEHSKTIEKNIMKSRLYKECSKLLLYVDYHGEVGTFTLIEDALINGKAVYLPKVHEGFNEARMDFYRIASSYELVDGPLGIPEPIPNVEKCFSYEDFKDEKLLMIVPGVAFDLNGNRLGYGKGYYDNYLKDKPNIVTVGVCFSMQLKDEIPADESDVKLDLIVTEKTPLDKIDSDKFK